jgi:predicted site-specific integrase-resolvase
MKGPLMRPVDVANHLGISTRQLRDLSQQGAIPFVDVSLGERPSRRYLPEDVEAFIQDRRTFMSPVTSSSTTVTTKRQPAGLDFERIRADLKARKQSEKATRRNGRR